MTVAALDRRLITADLPQQMRTIADKYERLGPSEKAAIADMVRSEADVTWKKLYAAAPEALAKIPDAGLQRLTPLLVPWERIVIASHLMAWAKGLLPHNAVIVSNGAGEQLADTNAPLFAAAIADMIGFTATPYWWSSAIWETILRDDSPLPLFTVEPAQFPHPIMWWTLETDFSIANRSDDWSISGYLVNIIAEKPMLTLVLLNMKAGVYELVSGPLADWGEEIRGGGDPRQTAQSIFRALAFVSSPYLITEQHRMPRPDRHRYQRATGEEASAVNVITLRSPTSSSADRSGDGIARDWQHRWLVRGHYRNQWYPSILGHKLIRVPPYMKGPQNKPLLTHLYAVAR